jgi:hypothetical protein
MPISPKSCAIRVAEAEDAFNHDHRRCESRPARDIKNLDSQIEKINIPTMTTPKTQDWHVLTELTQGRPIIVERVRLAGREVAIEGAFELPRLAQLSAEDQVFVAAFVRSHGSIKEMEAVFGVSYPTVKARLNRIADRLQLVEIDPQPSRSEVLERLKRGEISAAEAIDQLEGR